MQANPAQTTTSDSGTIEVNATDRTEILSLDFDYLG